MKNKIRSLPVPLQNLLIYRVALAILALGASLALAVFLHDVHFALPGLILCVTMLVSAVLLYRLLTQGRYLALRGTVLNVEQTMIRKHTKVIILEAEGKALRIQLRNRHVKVARGDKVALYLADTTKLYPWRGMYQLSGYLTLSTHDMSV